MLGISTATWTLIGGPGLAIITLAFLIYKERFKPKIDQAQVTKEVASSDQIRLEIERQSKNLSAERDLRVLDLEKWADLVRPAMRARDKRIEDITEVLVSEMKSAGKVAPDFPPLEPWPEPPLPRKVT